MKNKYNFLLAGAFLLVSSMGLSPLLSAAAGYSHLNQPIGVRAIAAYQHLLSERSALKLNADFDFRNDYQFDDELSQTHVRFRQLYKGIPVFGSDIIVHQDAAGRFLPYTLGLKVNQALSQDTTPVLGVQDALSRVQQDLQFQDPLEGTPRTELVIYPDMGRIGISKKPKSQWNATDVVSYVKKTMLAYTVEVSLIRNKKFESWFYVIDAKDGTIITKWDDLHSNAATGTGHSQYSGDVTIDTNNNSGTYEFRDLTRASPSRCNPVTPTICDNQVRDMANGTSGTGNLYTDADNTWGDGQQMAVGADTASANGQTAATDAAYGQAMAWNLYKNVFGRNGIDNQGSAVYSRVHFYTGYDNAFWTSDCFCMTYGDGGGTDFYSFASLDVTGHELTHGVTERSANLIYQGESGGLNEATSDIFGTTMEFYARGAQGQGATIPAAGTDANGNAANWKLGEQIIPPGSSVAGGALRFMDKPSLDGKSADAWSEDLDTLDVHYSSGPLNRMYYFLVNGASSDPSSNDYSPYLPAGMTGIGIDKAARIWYRALTVYLTPSSNYLNARQAALRAVIDLYDPAYSNASGVASVEHIAVRQAFGAINVGDPNSTYDDITAPAMPQVLSYQANNSVLTITFSVQLQDDIGVTKLLPMIDGLWQPTIELTTPAGADNIPENTTITLDVSAFPNGTNYMVIYAVDAAGNTQPVSLNYSIDFAFSLNNDLAQQIFNGGFEGPYGYTYAQDYGLNDFKLSSGSDGIYMCSDRDSHTGNSCAILFYADLIVNDPANLQNIIYWDLQLPADQGSLITFYAHIYSDATSGNTVAAVLENAQGQALKTLVTLVDNIKDSGWVKYQADVSQFQGQSVRLAFQGAFAGEDDFAAFLIDDVSVISSASWIDHLQPQLRHQFSGEPVQFAAKSLGSTNISWQVVENGCGVISTDGVYTSPSVTQITTCHIQASNTSRPDNTAQATVVVHPGKLLSSISAGNSHTLALFEGEVWYWGCQNYDSSYAACEETSNPNVQQIPPMLMTQISEPLQLGAGTNHSFVLDRNGAIWAWGNDKYGMLGNSAFKGDGQALPSLLGLEEIVSLSTGPGSAFALRANGNVLGWGANYQGQLGLGYSQTHEGLPIAIDNLSGSQWLAVGNWSSFAFLSNGTLWAFGDNTYGQLGDGTQTQRIDPVQISGLPALKQIAAGGSSTLALDVNGGVWAWGQNQIGALGLGDTQDRLIPTRVNGLPGDIVKLVINASYDPAYYSYSLALTSTGDLWGWGTNMQGQLALSGYSYLSPTRLAAFSGDAPIVDIAVGDCHSVALDSNNRVWTWGCNDYGQLGVPSTEVMQRSTPQPVSGIPDKIFRSGFE